MYMAYRNEITKTIAYYNNNVVVISQYNYFCGLLQRNYRSNNLLQRHYFCGLLQRNYRSNNLLQRLFRCNKLLPIIFVVYCNEITVALTYYLRVYCNGSQRLFGRCNSLYCSENGLIATTFFVVINDFSCSEPTRKSTQSTTNHTENSQNKHDPKANSHNPIHQRAIANQTHSHNPIHQTHCKSQWGETHCKASPTVERATQRGETHRAWEELKCKPIQTHEGKEEL